MWEKESLAAEAFLAAERKASQPPKKKAALKQGRHERHGRGGP